MRSYAFLLTLMLTLSMINLSLAAEVIQSVADYRDGRFSAHSEVLIQVPALQTRAILTRYEALPQVNGGIKAVTILERRDSGQVRMRVRAAGCILFICKSFNWVQEAETLASGDIMTVIDPSMSDFREGQVRYRLLPENENSTRLVTDAVVAPDFWFPPLIGPALIKRKLRDEALDTALGVERIAAQDKLD